MQRSRALSKPSQSLPTRFNPSNCTLTILCSENIDPIFSPSPQPCRTLRASRPKGSKDLRGSLLHESGRAGSGGQVERRHAP